MIRKYYLICAEKAAFLYNIGEDSLLPAVRRRYKNAIVIGDAKEVGRAPAAIRAGYEAGLMV